MRVGVRNGGWAASAGALSEVMPSARQMASHGLSSAPFCCTRAITTKPRITDTASNPATDHQPILGHGL